MKKILVNRCYGGFGFSKEMKEELGKRLGCEIHWDDDYATNPEAIALFEEHGSEWASGRHAKLKIVELPDETTDWSLEEYDGMEQIVYVVDGKLHWA